MNFLEKTDKELLDDFKFTHGLKIIEHYPLMYVLAHNVNGNPIVYATLLNTISERWIITDTSVGRSYMLKDSGLFLETDNNDDRLKNSFDSLKSAVDCFHRFYL